MLFLWTRSGTHGPRSWCWTRSASERGGPERAWTGRTVRDSRRPPGLETPASSPRSPLSPKHPKNTHTHACSHFLDAVFSVLVLWIWRRELVLLQFTHGYLQLETVFSCIILLPLVSDEVLALLSSMLMERSKLLSYCSVLTNNRAVSLRLLRHKMEAVSSLTLMSRHSWCLCKTHKEHQARMQSNQIHVWTFSTRVCCNLLYHHMFRDTTVSSTSTGI